jgi:hypothetical protein
MLQRSMSNFNTQFGGRAMRAMRGGFRPGFPKSFRAL